MAKSGSAARARLQQAAVELFRQNGFDDTTAAQIAKRAGVTERTFFRHFRDKREVLFDGQSVLAEALSKAIADAPPGMPPLDALFRAFGSVMPLIEANRPFSKPRQEVISATPALQERELAKHQALSATLAAALRTRGVAGVQAALAAQVGMAAFADATLAWLENEEPGLAERLDLAEKALRDLL
ncbi:TetR family transcriptional regulator [Citromicrobium bathyomarinum]|uniref:TetR family transcriptional regulator n=1 Tax=Citromicrobium TaxID=72173 RepID=UPI0001DD07F3|nr:MULTISPECIES: TetR family transcriptional regulator [Citromicrobium]ALG59462.1 TetR family transcriptional regulator [Citromicrobium sp. JL477]KPM16108.1 TetR family transcriptional regulator [Citromicrobium sp. JL1351]KPM19430.1 TetR family transcriptional regulator [Citromicrobium sp. JL31]KPM23748.1 TetR family transcriptional regulator [Citromicrobium sp. JL2201]